MNFLFETTQRHHDVLERHERYVLIEQPKNLRNDTKVGKKSTIHTFFIRIYFIRISRLTFDHLVQIF